MSSQTPERPYRSHSRPACLQCKRRRSRCKLESGQDACLMCRIHDTECTFPSNNTSKKISARPRVQANILPSHNPVQIALPPPQRSQRWNTQTPLTACWTPSEQRKDAKSQETPMSLDQAGGDEANTLVVGPAAINDSQVLADLANCLEPSAVNRTGMRLIRTMPGESGPVIFTTAQKRPLGMPFYASPSASKCQVIEMILKPYLDHLVHLYFTRVNICLPLLDEASFIDQYRNAKERISPALLCCLYANAMAFWRFDRQLASHQCPDTRYLWNVANEALYSELHLSPTISTIMGIMLNIGGRPSTAIIGNGVLLGSAVSLAHSLGLNRNPLPWDIPQPEKQLRMRIWWSLLIYDRWSSLAYGTPPHIQKTQYDVPNPSLQHLCGANSAERQTDAANIFVALFSLTAVLHVFLEQLYHVDKRHPASSSQQQNLELILDEWVEHLNADGRKVIIRGTRLEIPGASNLLLAYLTLKLLLRRIELNVEKDSGSSNPQTLSHRYVQVRRAAEEIVLLVQDLDEEHLGDFWLPVSAFAFTSTTAFLLRCALDTENKRNSNSTAPGVEMGRDGGLSQSPSLRLAHDLIVALRSHQEHFSWDLADICLAQYADVVEKLVTPPPPPSELPPDGAAGCEITQSFVPDASFIDALFPSIWNTLQGI